MSRECVTGRGLRVARLLAGAWRAPPGPGPDLPPDGEWLARFLMRTGAGALGWWRLRGAGGGPVAGGLRRAYQLHAVQAVIHEQRRRRLLRHLDALGVRPLLIKGWAAARMYPDPALRPYGDIDLAVAPGRLGGLRAAVATAGDAAGPVDLHAGVADLPDRDWATLWGRAAEVTDGDLCCRVLGPEDHLRLACLHLLRHGGWRPLWLCDVAVALEAAGPGFDWDYCLAGDPRRSAWVRAGVALAVELLAARCPTPIPGPAGPAPAWLGRAVLRQWGAGAVGDSHTRDTLGIAERLGRPWRLWEGLRARWPGPVEAAVKMRSHPAGRVPRWLLQLGLFCRRGAGRLVRRPAGGGEPLVSVHR